MAGHVEGRDDLDLPGLGCAQDLDVIRLCQKAVGRGVRIGIGAELGLQAGLLAVVEAAKRADLRQLGQRRDLEPPALVVAQVQVQLVELVGRHLLDKLQDFVAAVEVAAEVDVQPAERQPRRILDQQRTQVAVLERRLLRQRAQRVGSAGRVARHDANTAAAGGQPIILRPQSGRGADDDRDRHRAVTDAARGQRRERGC